MPAGGIADQGDFVGIALKFGGVGFDSGAGFSTDEMDRVFEAFYTTKPQGMGIGLSISRSIVQAHYGRLWAERNKDASGITVHFTVPVRDGFAGERDPRVPRA